MTESFEDVKADRVTGTEYARTFYMDKGEAVESLDPSTIYMRDLLGNATIYATLKFKGNKEACGLMNIDEDIKDINHAK
jgi:hypothetical protein